MAPGLASRAALGAIGAYQRWVSPYKGFRCAYAAAHGGPGCSGFAKERIARDGLWQAIAAIRRRFTACRAAAVLSVRDGEAAERSADKGDGSGGGGACNAANGACASFSGCTNCSGGPIACSCWS